MRSNHICFSVIKAGQEGYVNTYIICPGAVNGAGRGPVGKASLYFKYVGITLLKRKTVFKIGEGTNVLGFVSILHI